MKINLSVVIINYNTSVLTFNCVLSIIKQTPKNLTYEIIVIDNASSFEEYNDLKKMIDQLGNEKVFLFRSKLNGGFSAGNMLGVQFAKGEYLAFINNDVILVEDSFTYPLDYLGKNKHVGIVGIQPIFENNEKQVVRSIMELVINLIYRIKVKDLRNFDNPLLTVKYLNSFNKLELLTLISGKISSKS